MCLPRARADPDCAPGIHLSPGSLHQDAVLPAAEAAMDAARGFFRQPDVVKVAVENNEDVQYHVRDPRDGTVHSVPGSGNGYRAAGGDVYFAKDQRESINFGRETLEPDEEPPYANSWPRESSPDFGDGVAPGWRSTVLAHQSQMLGLSARLRRLIALALGAPPDTFEPFFTRPTFQTGMVYYHPAVSDPGQAVFAIRPHAGESLKSVSRSPFSLPEPAC